MAKKQKLLEKRRQKMEEQKKKMAELARVQKEIARRCLDSYIKIIIIMVLLCLFFLYVSYTKNLTIWYLVMCTTGREKRVLRSKCARVWFARLARVRGIVTLIFLVEIETAPILVRLSDRIHLSIHRCSHPSIYRCPRPSISRKLAAAARK